MSEERNEIIEYLGSKDKVWDFIEAMHLWQNSLEREVFEILSQIPEEVLEPHIVDLDLYRGIKGYKEDIFSNGDNELVSWTTTMKKAKDMAREFTHRVEAFKEPLDKLSVIIYHKKDRGISVNSINQVLLEWIEENKGYVTDENMRCITHEIEENVFEHEEEILSTFNLNEVIIICEEPVNSNLSNLNSKDWI